jgi:prepilin-type processing-associated H-X9-DG protein
LLLPALARAKAKAIQVSCLNNKRQIIMAWLMYPDDNSTRLAMSGLWVNQFVAGANMNFGWPPATNILPLITARGEFRVSVVPPDVDEGGGALGPYVKSPGPYKCPADRSTTLAEVLNSWGFPLGPVVILPRVRSISMNCAIWSDADAALQAQQVGMAPTALNGAAPPPPWLNYGKTADLVNPAPVNLWVFIDENPDSIDTGLFFANPTFTGPLAAFTSGPSLLHSGGTTFAFADGHTEIHKWLDPRTYGPDFQTHYTNDYKSNLIMPNNLDVAWLLARTTANADGSPAW